MERGGTLQSSKIHYQFDEAGLRVTKGVTPGLYATLVAVCNRLRIRTEDILAFVYASPDLNAGCYSADTRDCLITISSGLISLMSEDEMAFVIGHELGHFLLGHGAAHSGSTNTTEDLMEKRAMEISADRIGLLASPTKEAAFRALMKTTSGLDDSFLRFDINTFLDQLRSTVPTCLADSTHPSIVYRCRALLWFEMSKPFKEHVGGVSGEPIEKVNERVEKDMQSFIDGPAKRRIADAEESLHIWMATAAAVRQGTFSKQSQEHIANLFGAEYLTKILGVFDGCGRLEVESIVRKKLADAMQHYRTIAPKSFNSAFGKYQQQLAVSFAQGDFSAYVTRLLSE